MLRHLSKHHRYWFCSRCRIEMPDIEGKKVKLQKTKVSLNSAAIEGIIIPPKKIKSAVIY